MPDYRAFKDSWSVYSFKKRFESAFFFDKTVTTAAVTAVAAMAAPNNLRSIIFTSLWLILF